eukprot:TRINITY_DN15167_c0_g1_i1.p1 TRINITY_DN15167_c0_g1~~TRINITY_DN15167_c0_g1_i1.p1  ORF type:complete len:124 (-),score=16.79 TRINITY_DN15167_c0_g1_i1:60-431(-)
MVVVTAQTSRQLRAIAETLRYEFKLDGKIASVDDPTNDEWIVVNAGSVIYEIFIEQSRYYYDFDRLWLWRSADLFQIDAETAVSADVAISAVLGEPTAEDGIHEEELEGEFTRRGWEDSRLDF